MPGFDSIDDEELSELLSGAAGSIRSRLLPLAESSELRTQLFALAAVLDNAASHVASMPAQSDEEEPDPIDRVRTQVCHELARCRRIDWDELSRGPT